MDILATMRKRMDDAQSFTSKTRASQLDDLKFLAGSPDNGDQWPPEVMSSRIGPGQTSPRPTLTLNKLPQHVRQVTNDQRQNRPSGKVIPVDSNADVEIAEIYDGVIRHIEYLSNADVAYDTACENQVIFGEGFWRLTTEYCDDNSFDQDIKIKRIRNSFSVYMDPKIQDPCGEDAEWCIISQELTKDEYEHLFPDAASFIGLQDLGTGDSTLLTWASNNSVKIAEYFWCEYKETTLNQYISGETAFKGTPEDRELKSKYGEAIKTRKSKIRTIKWLKTNGYEILEGPQDWVGRYIPIIRVVGNEWEIDGRLEVSGIIRNAKDAQRLYNYSRSQQAEMIALAPKAPFVMYSGQDQGYEQEWATANIVNYPALHANAMTDATGNAILPLPQRAMPPMSQPGLMEMAMTSSDDIKSTTGQYDASLGMASNERSGKAIIARERQSDIGTYHYVDNLARAVRYTTRQLVDIIPKIYDTQRIARIIGEDGSVDTVHVDPLQDQAVRSIQGADGAIQKIYNLNVGKYDVMVTTGPSYLTKRQEALESMSAIMQATPQLWSVAGDLLVKNMDWPGAQELSKRIAKTIDPKLLDDQQSPQLAAANEQIQQMGQQLEAMNQLLNNVHNSIAAQEIKIKEYDAETKRISAVQAGMTPEQIQEIVMGTLHAAIDTGDIVGKTPFQKEEIHETE